MHRFVLILFISALFFPSGTPLSAQPPEAPQTKPPSTPETDPNSPGLWNTDVMMEVAVQQLTRRYSLNGEQEKYTRALLKKRVREYLKEHEGDLRGLLAEAIELQKNPDAADPKRMQEWSERALPLFKEARKAILDGNQEWREVLNDSQKQIHQFDLDQMHTNFAQMDEKFTRWSSGGYKKEDLYPQPPRQPPAIGPGRVGQPLDPKGPARSSPEDFWEIYVNSVVTSYKYTKEQETAARAILKDCREKAAQYRAANKSKLDDLTNKVNAMRAVPDKLAEFRKLNEQLTVLLKPVQVDRFNELKRRVEALATADQRAAVDAIRKQQQARLSESKRLWEQRRAKMTPVSSAPARAVPATQPVAATAQASPLAP